MARFNLGDAECIVTDFQLHRPSLLIDEDSGDGACTLQEAVMVVGNAVALAKAFHAKSAAGADQIAGEHRGEVIFEFGNVVGDAFAGQTAKRFCTGELIVLVLPAIGAPGEIEAGVLLLGHADDVMDRNVLGAEMQIRGGEADELGAFAG